MAIDKTSFRNAMARLGSAVSVVTTDGPAGKCGFTCTAVCSVTDDPATLLVCINRSSQMNAAFKQNDVFCVNVLSADQERLSAVFAGQAGVSMSDRFADGNWGRLSTGSPALLDAVEALDCTVIDVKEVGTHTILFGRVDAVNFHETTKSLIYLNRKYHSLPVADRASAVGSQLPRAVA
jgi:flavin reductase